MGRPVRFDTLADLYAAFPSAAQDVGAAADREPILAHVQAAIDEGAWARAASILAYLLGRREAVFWAAQSLRRMMRNVPGLEAVEAAEAWVRRPEEAERREALRIGTLLDGRHAATWVALAAAWTGGSIAQPETGHVPTLPEQTAKGVRAAFLIVLNQIPPDLIETLMRPCIEHGMMLARGPSGSGPAGQT